MAIIYQPPGFCSADINHTQNVYKCKKMLTLATASSRLPILQFFAIINLDPARMRGITRMRGYGISIPARMAGYRKRSKIRTITQLSFRTRIIKGQNPGSPGFFSPVKNTPLTENHCEGRHDIRQLNSAFGRAARCRLKSDLNIISLDYWLARHVCAHFQ